MHSLVLDFLIDYDYMHDDVLLTEVEHVLTHAVELHLLVS